MSAPRKLTEDEIQTRLSRLSGWTYEGGSLQKTFRFKNFVQAFGFMSSCALVAERLDHHPDWSNSYNRVFVQLKTHSADGITELDFQLAEAMEQLSRGFQQ